MGRSCQQVGQRPAGLPGVAVLLGLAGPLAPSKSGLCFFARHGEDLSKGFGMTKFKLVTRKWQVIQRFADFRHAGGEKAGAGWGTLREPWPPCLLPDRFAKDGLC